MELNVFMRELESALVQRGIPNETASRYVSSIRRTLTEDDIAEIGQYQTQDEVNRLADNIFAINKDRKQKALEAQTRPAAPASGIPPQSEPIAPAPAVSAQPSVYRPAAQTSPAYPPAETDTVIAPSAQPQPIVVPPSPPARMDRADVGYSYDASQNDDLIPAEDPTGSARARIRSGPAKQPPQRQKTARERREVDDYFDYSPDAPPSTKGMIIFWVGLFLTLPITLTLLAVIFGGFFAVFAALIALIVVTVVVIVALVAGGAVISLVGIVYGITQLIGINGGTFAAGLYEIGLGVLVAGIVFFFSVLLYNFAIRFLPWAIRKVAQFFRFFCGKLKDLFLIIRRRCYQL